MDALNSLHSTTFEIDEKHGTKYHKKLLEFIKMVQHENLVIGGAMTDVKGDRSKGPSEQEDPDLFVRIVERNDKGVYISGAKAHQTSLGADSTELRWAAAHLAPELLWYQ